MSTVYSKDDIARIVSEYKKADISNQYTPMCDNIVSLFEKDVELTSRQINCLLKQINSGVNDDIEYGFGDDIPNPKATITIKLDRVPRNCNECPMLLTEYDEDSMWGSGYSSRCVFGCSIWGSAIERPEDCPIVILTERK